MYQTEQIIVTEPSANIRSLARQALKGKWKEAIIAMIIYLVCVYLPYYIINEVFGKSFMDVMGNANFYTYQTSNAFLTAKSSNLSGLYLFLVAGAFTLGLTIFFMSLFRRQKFEYAQLFSGFENFVKALGLFFMIGLFFMLWSLLLIVPGIIALIRYSQAFYILADDPSKGVMQCINESKAMMRGNKAKYFCLNLSFIGWYFLSGLVAGIVTLPLQMFAGSAGIVVIFSNLLSTLFLCVVMAYVSTAGVAFYEILVGNLKAETSVSGPGQGAAWTDENTTGQQTPEQRPQTPEQRPTTPPVQRNITGPDR